MQRPALRTQCGATRYPATYLMLFLLGTLVFELTDMGSGLPSVTRAGVRLLELGFGATLGLLLVLPWLLGVAERMTRRFGLAISSAILGAIHQGCSVWSTLLSSLSNGISGTINQTGHAPNRLFSLIVTLPSQHVGDGCALFMWRRYGQGDRHQFRGEFIVTGLLADAISIHGKRAAYHLLFLIRPADNDAHGGSHDYCYIVERC